MIFMEVGNLGGLIFMFVFILFGPPIIMTTIGFAILKKKRKTAKVLFILATIYLIIGLGICGGLLS